MFVEKVNNLMNDMENRVLVSVCVLTYNSSAYVLETLESIYRQTYLDIELIISDDASSDDTLEKCQRWLDNIQQSRFRNIILLTTSQNTGVPANVNRAVRAAKGKWIKNIAGDDALLPTCIENCVNFVLENPQIRVFHSVIRKYIDFLDEEHFIGSTYPRKKMIEPSITAAKQFRLLQMGCWVLTPSVFISKELIVQIGYYDESIPLCEDWPMWLKISGNGIKIYFLDVETVQYRINNNSISHRKSTKFISDRQYQVLSRVYANYLRGHLPFFLNMEKKYSLALYLWLEKHGLNDTSKKFYLYIFRFFSFPLSFLSYLRYFYLTGWNSLFRDSYGIANRRLKRRILIK